MKFEDVQELEDYFCNPSDEIFQLKAVIITYTRHILDTRSTMGRDPRGRELGVVITKYPFYDPENPDIFSLSATTPTQLVRVAHKVDLSEIPMKDSNQKGDLVLQAFGLIQESILHQYGRETPVDVQWFGFYLESHNDGNG